MPSSCSSIHSVLEPELGLNGPVLIWELRQGSQHCGPGPGRVEVYLPSGPERWLLQCPEEALSGSYLVLPEGPHIHY